MNSKYLVKKKNVTIYINLLYDTKEERGGSVAECLTQDQGVVGLSLTPGTALCP